MFTTLLGAFAFVVFSAWAAWWFVRQPGPAHRAAVAVLGNAPDHRIRQLAILFPEQVADSALEGLQAYVARNSVSLTLILVGGLIIALWIRSFDALDSSGLPPALARWR